MEIIRALKAHFKSYTKRDGVSAVFCFLLISGSLLLFWFSSLSIPDISLFEQREIPESTKIYDRTGNVLLYDVSKSIRRSVVSTSDISQNIKNAAVAIEDSGFYNHGGIRLLSIVRAILNDIVKGGAVQGGSTITQQLIKNTLLTNDKTAARKIKEWILAIKLEKVLSKDDILTLYLNEVPYGGNIYGIEEASKEFFNKDASDLSIAEAAYLAAIPKAPTYYSPYGQHKDDLDKRKNNTLEKMKEFGFITSDQYNRAVNEQVVFEPQTKGGIRAPHFVMYVKQYLEDTYGVGAVENGGLKVITTLNADLEAKMESEVKNYIENNGDNFNMSNTASVAIDPKTGDILGMVGSYDYFSKIIDGNFNVATAENRQPGSTFKPIVYSEAFIRGYTPETVLFDLPTEFNSGCDPDGNPISSSTDEAECYKPEDFDGKYRGPISLRSALALSINIPSIQLSYLAGLKDSINLAKKMGITSLDDPNQYGLTLVLGGGGVSLLEMTSAYGVFANDGAYVPYRSILRITDQTGAVIEEADPNVRSVEVMPSNVARTITDILSDDNARAAEYGLHSVFDIDGYSVAAKTGTTNNTRDVWTVGYSPDVVVGVWAGNNDNSAMIKKIAGLIIAPLWHNLMSDALSYGPNNNFMAPAPEDLQNEKPIFRGMWQGGESYIIDTISKKLATDYTPPETKKEIVLSQNIHSILYWVDKKDPRGPRPKNPENDSQFVNWEKPVADYVLTNGFTGQIQSPAPTLYDDIHVPANLPVARFPGFDENRVYDQNDVVNIPLGVSSRYPIQKISIYANGAIIATLPSNQSSFQLVVRNILNLSKTNSIKVEIVDSVFNRANATLNLKVNAPQFSQ